jgi:hypothetical protein
MAAPTGNQNAKGHNGGNAGRKTAYGEQADANFLWEMFTNPQSKEELANRIRSGTHSLLDVMVVRAMAGSDKLLGDIFRKLFPDNLNMTASLNQKQMQTLEENVKTILDVATKQGAKSVTVHTNPEQLSETIRVASQALMAGIKDHAKKKAVKKRL